MFRASTLFLLGAWKSGRFFIRFLSRSCIGVFEGSESGVVREKR
jgi:hypothetical protein